MIGNYYSLRREHEKAILYFRRALKLDRAYLSAWTLMGHEYVEIKNTNAAIASYRRAVGASPHPRSWSSRGKKLTRVRSTDVNRKDYRAWYGLGQTYELLGEPFYALNYYQKATALRPYDARMWSALAVCYEKLKRFVRCYRAAFCDFALNFVLTQSPGRDQSLPTRARLVRTRRERHGDPDRSTVRARRKLGRGGSVPSTSVVRRNQDGRDQGRVEQDLHLVGEMGDGEGAKGRGGGGPEACGGVLERGDERAGG
jgi:hypothetical protein